MDSVKNSASDRIRAIQVPFRSRSLLWQGLQAMVSLI